MFVPDGYFYLPEIVTWVAKLGAEGKLPRRLGFIHPGDVTDPLALSAEATARFALGEMLAANAIPAEFIIFPSGLRLPVPAYYWSSESAAATMKTGKLDLNAIGYQNNLHTADVILPIDKVAAALGIRLIPLPEDSRAPEPLAVTGRETKGSMFPTALPAWVPVVEVLGHIIFGRPDGFTDDNASRLVERWGGLLHFTGILDPKRNALVRGIECLLARENWWRERQPPPCPLPLYPQLRADLRLAWHRHGRRPFRELLAELPIDLAAYQQAITERDAAWAKAVEIFKATANKSSVVLYGREGLFNINGGGRFTSDRHIPVNLSLFANSRRIITQDNWTAIPRFDNRRREDEFGDLKILGEDLTKFPLAGGRPVDVAPRASAIDGEKAAPRLELEAELDAASAAADAPEQGDLVSEQAEPVDPRPAPSDRAVRAWCQNRVATWPDDRPAPSEGVDWFAIAQHFRPGLTREEFRIVRQDEMPVQWRTQGPRPLWGQVKAKKSAKKPR